MANRTLARADDNPGEILEDGELHKVGIWEQVTIERSAAGREYGVIVSITRFEDDQVCDVMSVGIKDAAAFLAPVNAWLRGNDPEPWTDGETRRAKKFGPYLPIGQLTSYFDPRPGYNQRIEDYS
jgi:hypothetical protein